MKIIILLTIVSVSCCIAKVNSKSQGDPYAIVYKVYKIDSINNYYLIYARRQDSIFKIVSKKMIGENCEKIRENIDYEFKLHSSLSNRSIGDLKILRQNSLLVNCFSFDDSTKICLERDSINDLFYADNIKGLCFKNE